jgi:arylsulfatase A-like enzyme
MYAHNHRSVLNGTPLDARFTNLALEARGLGYEPVLFGYTDASVDPRTVEPGDPRLSSYEGVLPGFRAVVDLPEHLEAWAQWLVGLGYDVPANRRELYRPVRDEPGAPTVYAAEHTEAAFLTGEVLRWLDEDAGDEPWFVHAAYIRPHPPFVAPEPYHAMYDPDQVPRPVRHTTVEQEAAQHLFLAGALSIDEIRAPRDERELRQLRATYYGMMTEVDAQLGRLFDGLRARGQWDETLVVVTSDHGEQLGDHWLIEKLGWFDSSYRIPLVVRDPRPEADVVRGRVVDAFTENVDVMPTILEWLAADVPVQCDGRSLLPWLHGATPSSWRGAVFWEFDFRDPVGAARGESIGLGLDESCLTVIRDRRGKYVHFAALPPLFFDLARDPGELDDRSHDPAYTPALLEYAQRMLSWRMRTDDRTLTGFFLSPDGLVDARAPSVPGSVTVK